jgi:hypothetical protein
MAPDTLLGENPARAGVSPGSERCNENYRPANGEAGRSQGDVEHTLHDFLPAIHPE